MVGRLKDVDLVCQANQMLGSVLIWKPNLDSRFKLFLKFRRPFLTLGYHAFLNPLEDGLMLFARLWFNLYDERLFFFVHLFFPRAAIATLTALCGESTGGISSMVTDLILSPSR